MLRVVSDLKRVTGVIGGHVGDEHQWLTAALLVVIHRDAAGSNFGHGLLLVEFLLQPWETDSWCAALGPAYSPFDCW